MCAQTPVRAKGLAAPLDRARKFNPGLTLFMNLQVVLERLWRRQGLGAPLPCARIGDPDQAAGMFETVAGQVLGRAVRVRATGLGARVPSAFLLLLAQTHMGCQGLFGPQSDLATFDRALEPVFFVHVAVVADVAAEALVSRVGAGAVANLAGEELGLDRGG